MPAFPIIIGLSLLTILCLAGYRKARKSLIARIIGLSLLTAALGAGLGFALAGNHSDWSGISLMLACVGGIIGAIAGAAQGIVSALRQDVAS